MTNKALFDCITNFCTQTLKESNQGYFLIPCFNDGTRKEFFQKNSIPIYPFVKSGSVYTICRGLILEFLHTGKTIACSDPLLEKKLSYIQETCISKSIGLIKAYNSSEKRIPSKILRLSYTPEEEMENERKNYLYSFYNKIYKDIKKPVYLETFLARLYGETVLTLLEEIPTYWSHYNLLAFFLGAPGKGSLKYTKKKIKGAFLNYFKIIRDTQNSLDHSYAHLIKDAAKNHLDSLLELQINHKEKILFATSLMDVLEKFCINRSEFYEITETLFRNLFPKEHQVVSSTLKQLLNKIGGTKELDIMVKNIEKELKKLNRYVLAVEYRIRQPAGLYQHHLMKQRPLTKIDDIVSIQIKYKNKNKI